MSENGDTFIKVTNADIYRVVMETNERCERIEKQALLTNGKVKLLKMSDAGLWASVALLVGIVVWILQQGVK